MPKNESRNFIVDSNILKHIINSQGSDIVHAIKELIQNSYDADASYCNIELNKEGFICKDNGKGFSDKNEIISHFETFGKEHLDDKDDKIGRFRMGRGQIMSLAKTQWKSNDFTMSVDINKNGLKYDLLSEQPQINGCEIIATFYQPIEKYMVDSYIRKLSIECAYIQKTLVTINGSLINPPLEHDKLIDNELFFVFSPQNHYDKSIEVYNLGIYVTSLNSDYFGFKGILVTRKNLSLNTSRTSIMQTCPKWSVIKKMLLQFGTNSILSKKSFTVIDSIAIWNRIFSNKLNISTISGLKIFHTYNGSKKYSFLELLDSKLPITSNSATSNIKDDMVVQKNIAIVLNRTMFDSIKSNEDLPLHIEMFKFLYNECDLTDIEKNKISLLFKTKKIVDIKELYKSVSDQKEIIADDKLNPKQTAAIKAIRTALSNHKTTIVKYLTDVDESREEMLKVKQNFERKIYLGKSLESVGWTDGLNYIVINKDIIKHIEAGISGCEKIVYLLFHEYSHSFENMEEHDFSFYKTFHDIIIGRQNLKGKTIYSVVNQISTDIIVEYTKHLFRLKQPIHRDIKRYIPKDEINKRISSEYDYYELKIKYLDYTDNREDDEITSFQHPYESTYIYATSDAQMQIQIFDSFRHKTFRATSEGQNQILDKVKKLNSHTNNDVTEIDYKTEMNRLINQFFEIKPTQTNNDSFSITVTNRTRNKNLYDNKDNLLTLFLDKNNFRNSKYIFESLSQYEDITKF